MTTASISTTITNVFSFARSNRSAVAVKKASTATVTDGNIEMATLVRQLKDIYRTPFLLFYRGYDYSEIAAQLKLPVGTVKSRIFMARTELKSQIAQRKAA